MSPLPKLVTFDGEARSGKGTIAHATKDYLRDKCGRSVMLIDAGQVFRVLVLAIERAGVDVDSPDAIDDFLSNDDNIQTAVQLVKSVYHMPKLEREELLYTSHIGVDSAKVGARPLSQEFKDKLLRKWLNDARNEGIDTVLLDGRALEEVGEMLEHEGLCEFVIGLYFVCNPLIGARRTLGIATVEYEDIADDDKVAVDELVAQIIERNNKDSKRKVQPIIQPKNAIRWILPQPAPEFSFSQRPMLVIDTGEELDKPAMTEPVVTKISEWLERVDK